MHGRPGTFKIVLIFLLIAVMAVLQYSTELNEHRHHILYQGLFFLPIMLAAFWFGLRGALAISLSVSLLLLPFTLLNWKGFSAWDFNEVIELILYNTVALILGILKNREQIEQQRRCATERLATMGQTASGLAHDMKTGLAVIGGFSRHLQKNRNFDDAGREKLRIIIAETRRMEAMVEDMLDFARPLELHPSQQDLNRITAECFTVLSEKASERKVELKSNVFPDLPFVWLDPLRLKQMLLNLLLNAIEASPEGESVELIIYPKSKRLVFEIRDQGCGLAPDVKEKIFSPFFTTKDKGSGLGLPIVQRIIEANGGILEVLENPVKGVTFRVVFPMAEGISGL